MTTKERDPQELIKLLQQAGIHASFSDHVAAHLAVVWATARGAKSLQDFAETYTTWQLSYATATSRLLAKHGLMPKQLAQQTSKAARILGKLAPAPNNKK